MAQPVPKAHPKPLLARNRRSERTDLAVKFPAGCPDSFWGYAACHFMRLIYEAYIGSTTLPGLDIS